jgi:hypothetical protein
VTLVERIDAVNGQVRPSGMLLHVMQLEHRDEAIGAVSATSVDEAIRHSS